MNKNSWERLDPYGINGACKPWNSVDALEKPKTVHGSEPQECIDRCTMHCPYDDCENPNGCRFRLGLPPKEKEKPMSKRTVTEPEKAPPVQKPKEPPRGYDREKLERAMALSYSMKELAKRLKLTPYMARKWVEFREEENT